MTVLKAIWTKLASLKGIGTAGSATAISTTKWIERGTNKEAEHITVMNGEVYGYAKDGEFLYPLVKTFS
jgi:hypothetical protein